MPVFARVPGIHIAPSSQGPSLPLWDRRTVAGFLGVCERGPLHTPVRLTSYDAYRSVFGGFGGAGRLAFSVYQFFNCGGRECYVVRVAHTEGEGGASASSSALESVHGDGLGTLRARSVGTWGNSVGYRVWHSVDERLEVSAGRLARVRLATGPLATVRLADQEEGVSGEGVPEGTTVRLTYSDGSVSFLRAPLSREAVEGPAVEGEAESGRLLVSAETLRFNLQVWEGARSEEFLFLSADPASDRHYAAELARSRLVEADSWDPLFFPVATPGQYLTGGHDGVIDLSAGDFIGRFRGLDDNRGLGIFEAIPTVSLLCVPDLDLLGRWGTPTGASSAEGAQRAVREAAVSQAERLGDRIAILDAPPGNVDEKRSCANTCRSAFAAMYYPQVEIIDPRDSASSVLLPPSGAVAGIIAACDEEEGVYVPPANRLIPGGVGLAESFSDEEFEMLMEGGLNGLRVVPGRGIKVWGARTLSSDPEWRYLNVRRTFSLIAAQLRSSLRWAVFEPNTPSLRKRIVRHLSALLIDLWRKGYLAGKTPEEAFYVRCDEELNPPESVDAGIVCAQAGICIVKPVEYMIVTLNAERENARVVVKEDEDA